MKITNGHVLGVCLLILGILLLLEGCSNPTATAEVHAQVTKDSLVATPVLICNNDDHSKWKRLRDSIEVLNAQIVILEWNACIDNQMKSAVQFRIRCLTDFISDNGLTVPKCPARGLNPAECNGQ